MNNDYYEFQRNYEALKLLYENHPQQIVNILNASMRTCKSNQHEKEKQPIRRLYEWIFSITSHMDEYGCALAQRIHWILNRLTEFPQCSICEKPIVKPKQFKTIQTGYKPFCSNECAKVSRSLKSKQTRFLKNNGKYFSDESIVKSKLTFIAHYGVDNNMKSEEGKKAYSDAVEKKYGKDIRNVFQAECIKEKICATKLARYNDENWNNGEKGAQTRKNRPQHLKDAQKQQFKWKSLEHYGVDHPMKHHDVYAKAMKNRKNGCYAIDGYVFESKPEFCFYVCCRDFGIVVECHPVDKAIMYTDAIGNTHVYFPDFYVPSIGRLVEIKGNQFFENHDETSRLIDIYGNDADTHKTECKWRAMLENNVLVISTSRYHLYEQHVKRKYGNKWIRLHKVAQN